MNQPLEEYKSKLSNGQYSLRLGKQVPEGDVNLSYIHTPDIDPDENIAIMDTSSVPDNVIPEDVSKSLLISDQNGKLHFAKLTSDDQAAEVKPPYDIFPSKDLYLTNEFNKQEISTNAALFYKMEIKYHYDSKQHTPNKVEKYTGDQIKVTDENGNPLDDQFLYAIYVMAMPQNPHIHWVKIYLNFNTDEVQTFKVLYNHIDEVVSNNDIHAKRNCISLYGNHMNKILVDGRTKSLMEGGKLRIINGESALKEVSQELFQQNPSDDLYYISENSEQDGYEIFVNQKAENDPRVYDDFNYRIVANFYDYEGKKQSVTTGYIQDWVMHPDSLFEYEKKEYTGKKKYIGIPYDTRKLTAREMIEASLPPTIHNIPEEAELEVQDAKGNVLYTFTNKEDNPKVNTMINQSNQIVEAESTSDSVTWEKIKYKNVLLRRNPLKHACTIYAERQKTKWEFKFKITGKGKIADAQGNIKDWTTSNNKLDVYGSGFVNFSEDGSYEISYSPKELPNELIPPEVADFKWNNPVITQGDHITVQIAEDKRTIQATATLPPIQSLDKWVVIKDQEIKKDDGIKTIASLFEKNGIFESLKIPESIPKEEILLRIERGEPDNKNQNFKVNYRFRVNTNGIMRFPVDQHPNQFGVNRLRLASIFTEYSPVKFDVQYKILIPITKSTDMKDLFARNAQGSVTIERENGISSWTIQDGVLKDLKNNYEFVAAYNTKFLNTKNHTTDFAFKPTGDDDDLIGVLFRVQDKNNFYFYCIEADDINPVEVGSRIDNIQPEPLFEWKMTNRKNASSDQDYMYQKGWKTYHQRVYKVEKGKKTLIKSFSTVSNEGFIREWQNNIRVECIGNVTNLYFQTGTVDEDRWKKIYTIETKWNKGSFGIMNFSQKVEFLKISTIEYEDLEGTIKDFSYTGSPELIVHPSTKAFFDRYIRDQIEKAGYERSTDYKPVYYKPIKKSDGQVSIAENGVGPVTIISTLDTDISKQKVDLVAWTHYENLEAVPVFACKYEKRRKIELEKPKVSVHDAKTEGWYIRVKDGKFQKRLQLPYYEEQEKTPEIYNAYPELQNYAPNDPEHPSEVILEYSIPEYHEQRFYHKPGILVEKEKPIVLNEYAIQVTHTPIVLESEDGISYLEVQALRKNTARKLKISDVDAAKGIIYLHDRIREEDEILVRYMYKERYYTYKGFEKQIIKMEEIIVVKQFPYQATFNLKAETKFTKYNKYLPDRVYVRVDHYIPEENAQFFTYPVDVIYYPHVVHFTSEEPPYSPRKAVSGIWFSTYENAGPGFYPTSYEVINPHDDLYVTVNHYNRLDKIYYISILAYSYKPGKYPIRVIVKWEDAPPIPDFEKELLFEFIPQSEEVTLSNEVTDSKMGMVHSSIERKTHKVLLGSYKIADLFPNNPDINTNTLFDLSFNVIDAKGFEAIQAFYSNDTLISSRKAKKDDIINVYGFITTPVVKDIKMLDPEILGYFHLDFNPTPGHKYTVNQSGNFENIPSEHDKQLLSSELAEKNSLELLAKPIHIYLKPTLIRDHQGKPIYSTIRNKAIYHTDEEFWFNPNDYYYEPTMLRLGTIYVQANSNMNEDMIILDTRSRGGGLKESISRKIIEQVDKKSLEYWDIGYHDGTPYQENGVIIVRLPNTLLKQFHESEIQQAISKHKAHGVLPIIEYYDPNVDQVYQKGLLENTEFLYGEHLSYYNPSLSKGSPQILYQEGTGDNYILRLPLQSQYGLTIPGYRFDKSEHYQIEIKCKLDEEATPRNVAIIELYYDDGTKETIKDGFINQKIWTIKKIIIPIQKPLHKVNILFNDANQYSKGSIDIDYVLLYPIIHIEDKNEVETYKI